MPKPRKKCVECNDRYACRPRGLCWRCYYKPGVVEQHPPPIAGRGGYVAGTSTVGISGDNQDTSGPCPYPAGSPEKIEWIARRAMNNQPLWHPDDSQEQTPVTITDIRVEHAERTPVKCRVRIKSGSCEVRG